MAEKLRLSSIEGGGNWWITLNWAAQSFRNAGFEVEMTRRGHDASDTITRVVRGEADIAVTLGVAASQATQAKGIYKDGRASKVTSLALALRPGHHWYNMVRADTGIRSFADIAKMKPKLGVQVGEADFVAGPITQAYLAHYGVDMYRDTRPGAARSSPCFRNRCRCWFRARRMRSCARTRRAAPPASLR